MRLVFFPFRQSSQPGEICLHLLPKASAILSLCFLATNKQINKKKEKSVCSSGNFLTVMSCPRAALDGGWIVYRSLSVLGLLGTHLFAFVLLSNKVVALFSPFQTPFSILGEKPGNHAASFCEPDGSGHWSDTRFPSIFIYQQQALISSYAQLRKNSPSPHRSPPESELWFV